MKVLVLNNTVNYAGSNISFLNLAEGLIPKGVEFVIAGPKIDNDFFSERIVKLKIKYIIIPVNYSVYPRLSSFSGIRRFASIIAYPSRLLKTILMQYVVRNKLYSLINEIRPDIIHTNTGVLHDGIICSHKTHIPHVIHLREYQDLDFGYHIYPSKRKFENMLRTTNVITITHDITNHFHLENYCNCSVIYNGILQKNNVAFEWPKQKFFLCCSRISEKKGHEDVIRAFAQFSKNNKDYKLVILGEGDDKYINKLKRIASELNCDRIEWPGFSNNPYDYMKKATALIVASFNEGFGRMTAEAVFAGCLTIGRNTAGTREIIERTGGVLFEDVDHLCSGMMDLTNYSEQEYYDVIHKGQTFAIENYSIEANLEKTYEVYKKILKPEQL